MTFTPEQLKNWQAYERVRASSEYNMFDPRAAQAAGLNSDEHLFCMRHFDALKKASNEQAA